MPKYNDICCKFNNILLVRDNVSARICLNTMTYIPKSVQNKYEIYLVQYLVKTAKGTVFGRKLKPDAHYDKVFLLAELY